MKTNILFILVLAISISSVFADSNFVSIEGNGVNISSPETVYCHGTVCTIEYSIMNLGSVDKNVVVSNVFHSDKVSPQKFEKYGQITETRSVNNPYPCDVQTDVLNDSVSDVNSVQLNENGSVIVKPVMMCDNVTSYDYTYQGFSEMSSDKASNEINNNDLVTLSQNSEQKFKTTVYQPLGQKTKYDIKATDDDNKETTLDPFLDSNNYYINLSSYFTPNQTIWDASKQGALSVGSTGGAIRGLIWSGAINGSATSIRIKFQAGNTVGLNTSNYAYIAEVNGLDVGKVMSGTKRNLTFNGSNTFNLAANGVVYSDVMSYNITSGKSYSITYHPNDGSQQQLSANTSTGGFVGCFIRYPYASGQLEDDDWSDNSPTPQSNSYTSALLMEATSMNGNFPINSLQSSDNLSISSSGTGVVISYNNNVVTQLNDTALGNNLLSGQCYNLIAGKTSLNWSIFGFYNSSDGYSKIINYTFTNCFSNETQGRDAIIQGVIASELGTAYNSYNDKNVYIRLANTTQALGAFDVFITSGNKRYAFNYNQNSSISFPTMYNITPVFYVWQNFNMSSLAIKNSVQSLIDSTN